VERIGAAMMFGRQTTSAIPDREAALTSDFSLNLASILPDWSGDDRVRLLTRPIFDPATFGRVRFHNDNDGTVRSFLTAKWLVRLRKSNLSTANLFRLLFSNSYGLEVIKPSLTETVAWLCLWDKDVANEVVRRAPNLLLTGGDPASLSASVRSAALAVLLRELTNSMNSIRNGLGSITTNFAESPGRILAVPFCRYGRSIDFTRKGLNC
jgi:hypothetical protein